MKDISKALDEIAEKVKAFRKVLAQKEKEAKNQTKDTPLEL